MTADALLRGVALFNAGQYRDALLAFEGEWVQVRVEPLRALVLTSNALHQLTLGLLGGPRRNIATALRLLSEAGPSYASIDLAHLHAALQAVAHLLEADTPPPTIPAIQLRFVHQEPVPVSHL